MTLVILSVCAVATAMAQAPHRVPAEAREAFDRGVALRAGQNLQGALTELSHAVQVDPEFSEAWRQRGLVYSDMERLKEAMADLDQAIKADPRNAKAFVSRGFVRAKQRDYKGAILEITKAIEIDPQYSNAYMNRGTNKYRLGDRQGAIADYDRAIESDPRNAPAIYSRGVVRAELKDAAGAREDFRRSLDVDPNHAYAAQTKQQLAALSSSDPGPRGAAGAPPAPAPPAGTSSPAPAPRSPSTSGPPAVGEPSFLVADVVRVSMPKDPLDRSSWPTGDVLWASANRAPLALSAAGQAIRVPGHLEFARMSPGIYAAAISAAKEAMRLIQGPLTPDAEQAFDAKWAPCFDYPSQEVIEYFNKLNPLLARFLDGRAGFNTALQALQKELLAAGAAASENDGEGAATAMSAARAHKTLMDGYERAMGEAEAAIAALGPVPNPFEVRARHAKALAAAVAELQPAPAAKPEAVGAAEYWVLSKGTVEEKPSQSGGDYVYTFSHAEGFAAGSVDVSQTDQVSKKVFRDSIGGSVKWTIPPRLVRAAGGADGFESSLEAQCTQVRLSSTTGAYASLPCASVVVDTLNGDRTAVQAAPAKPADRFAGKIIWRSNFGNEMFVDVRAGTAGGSATYHYTYTLQKLSAAQAADVQAKAEESVAQSAQQAGLAAADAAARGTAARAKAEGIAFQKEMALYFGQQSERAAAGLARATDPAVLKALTVQELAYDASRAAAEDHEAYLETGQWQRTRTLYDAYNLAVMDRNASEEAARAREPENIANATLRQVDLMPPELRAAVRATWDSQVTAAVIMNRDTATMKRASAQVAQQVRAYWSGIAGREEDTAAVMHGLTLGAQATEIGAGIALIGVAGSAAAGAGLTGAVLWGAEMLTGAAYGGATGYVQGGPDEAARRALQWAGTLGFAASEGLDGWARSGDAATGVKTGAQMLLFGKAAEIGIKWAGAKAWKPGPTGLEAAEVAEYGRGLAAGRQAIARAEKAEWTLAQAMGKGATQAEIDRLTLEAQRHAAALNADWYAKFHLKTKGATMAGQAFDRRVTQVYESVMPEFTKELERRGYNAAAMRFKPMRNPSSAGTVSMDLDLALIETPGLTILKNGSPASRGRFQQDAQAAWDKVYQARTGQSAARSLLNITTSAHREAFTTKLLQKRVPWGTLTPAEIAQAADAVRVKVSDMPLPAMAKFVENARGLEKEMRTKILPSLSEQAARAANRGDAARAQSMRESQKYLQGIYDQLAEIGKHEHAPLEIWQLHQRLTQTTGGKSVWELADALGVVWEASAKVK
jgi:tetratricopeptide (TPR) repeat protein